MGVAWLCLSGMTTIRRRQWRFVLLPFFLLALIATSSTYTNASTAQPGANNLLSIYLLALDSDLGIYEQTLVNNIIAGTGGKYDRTALIVIDSNGPHDTRVEVARNGAAWRLDGLPNTLGVVRSEVDEYDMADGATLGGLLQWARQNFPANQTLVTFVGHGLPAAPIADVDQLWPRQLTAAGQLAVDGNNIPLPTKYWAHPNFTDNHPKRTLLTPKQLGIALALATNDGADPIAVLDLIHCFGATMEQLVEVAPYVQATVGSPSYAYLQPEMLKRSLLELPSNLSAIDLAKQLATYHQIQEPNHPTVITAVDNSRLTALHNAWNGVAGALLQRLQQDPTTRERLTLAWRQAAKYDAPLCDDEWRIDESDYLADLGSLAHALQAAFPGEPVAVSADQVLAQLSAAVTTLTHADHPWMRPAEFWNFDSRYAGIALYGNLLPLLQDGQAYLSFQGHFYNSTAAEVAYRFLGRRTPNDTTWADLFTTFWQGQTVQTVACLPALQVTGGNNADLGLLIDLPAMPVTIADNIAYTLTVQNIGSLPANDVILYPTIPATVTLQTLDPRCQVINGAITCPMGAMAAGAKAAVVLVVKPAGIGALTFGAEATSRRQDNGLSNYWTSAALVVQPSAEGCVLRAWDRNAVYVAKDQVSHQGHIWQAKWWTQGEEPGTTGQWGVWLDQGACQTQPAVTTPPSTIVAPTPLPTVPTTSPAAQLFLPLAIR